MSSLSGSEFESGRKCVLVYSIWSIIFVITIHPNREQNKPEEEGDGEEVDDEEGDDEEYINEEGNDEEDDDEEGDVDDDDEDEEVDDLRAEVWELILSCVPCLYPIDSCPYEACQDEQRHRRPRVLR